MTNSPHSVNPRSNNPRSGSPHRDSLLLQRLSKYALGAGIVLVVLSLVALLLDPLQFERSYLVAFFFTLAPAAGALALLAIYRLTGGRWGDAIFDILAVAVRTLPFFALLFVPILIGLGDVFPWAAPGWAESEAATQHKLLYLDVRFFVARAVLYFAIWSWLAHRTLAPTTETASTRAKGQGAMALLAYVLTTTFAAFDWGMSLGPEWYSTMYGFIVIVGQILSALTLAILIRWLLDRIHPERALEAQGYHDLGTLLFAFVTTWAYLGFSQFLIIWSADLPEEVGYYMERLAPGWKVVATAILIVHFAVPFMLLLMRKVKRKARHLALVCALVFAARLLEFIWLIVPAFHQEEFRIHWLDLVLPLALLSLWCWIVLGTLHKRLAAHSPPLSTLEPTVTP